MRVPRDLSAVESPFAERWPSTGGGLHGSWYLSSLAFSESMARHSAPCGTCDDFRVWSGMRDEAERLASGPDVQTLLSGLQVSSSLSSPPQCGAPVYGSTTAAASAGRRRRCGSEEGKAGSSGAGPGWINPSPIVRQSGYSGYGGAPAIRCRDRQSRGGSGRLRHRFSLRIQHVNLTELRDDLFCLVSSRCHFNVLLRLKSHTS